MSNLNPQTIITWLRERNQKRMMDTFPVLVNQHGLEALKLWRLEGSKHEHTIVHELTKKGSVEVIKFLVERHGFDLNVHRSSDLCTPLHLAQWTDQEDLVQQLIDLGADPSLKNKYGEDVHQTASSAKTVSARLQGCKKAGDVLELLGNDFDAFSDTDLMHAYSLLGMKTADYDAVLCRFTANNSTAMDQQNEIRSSPVFKKLSAALQKLVVHPSASQDGSIWDTVIRAMIKLKDASILEAMANGAMGYPSSSLDRVHGCSRESIVKFDAWTGVHLVHCAWGLAKLKVNMAKWKSCFTMLLDLLVDRLDELLQAELSSLMWTLGETRFRHDEALRGACERILNLGADATAQTLCMAIWAHVRTDSDSDMPLKLVDPIIRGIPTFPHLDITLIAWGYAKLKLPHEDIFLALFSRAGVSFYEETSRHHGKVTNLEKTMQWAQIYYAYRFCSAKCPKSLSSLSGQLAKDLRGIDDHRSGESCEAFSQASGLSGRSLKELDKLIDAMESCQGQRNGQWQFEDSMEPILHEVVGDDATQANAAVGKKLLGMDPEPSARFVLLEFSRDPKSFHAALMLGPELASLRDDLDGHELSLKHSSGAKICVSPTLYQLALDAVAFHSIELKPRHVLTTAENEDSILTAITSSCRSRERVTLKSKNENVWLLEAKTFGNAGASDLAAPDDELVVRVTRTFIDVSVPNSLCSFKPRRFVKSA